MHLAVALGSGMQWLSWIHIDDLVRLIACCVDDREWSGAFNATAPEPVRQAQFAAALAARFGRSMRVRVPARALRLALGEMAQLLVDGQRVLPFKAKCRGFEFEHATLAAALADLLSRRKHDTQRRARGIKAEALWRS
jgi:NAD dependent epimerase/dehydratase family enzyme